MLSLKSILSSGLGRAAGPLERCFLSLVFLKAALPITIISIGEEEYSAIIERVCLGYV